MRKEKKFPIDLFKHGVKVIFGSEEELLASAQKDGLKEEVKESLKELGCFKMATFLLSTGDAIIYGKDFKHINSEYATISHEIFHAVSHVLRNVGIEHTPDTEEAYAYIIEYLTQEIFNWLSSAFP